MTKKVPDAIKAEALKKMAEDGLKPSAIVKWLRRTHGIKVSIPAVYQWKGHPPKEDAGIAPFEHSADSSEDEETPEHLADLSPEEYEVMKKAQRRFPPRLAHGEITGADTKSPRGRPPRNPPAGGGFTPRKEKTVLAPADFSDGCMASARTSKPPDMSGDVCKVFGTPCGGNAVSKRKCPLWAGAGRFF